ncbi:MAG: hypothetical protein PHH16_03815 [Candidatus Gracilibacteria bacterium]|nr:hypothetical protein [Candidatus Gracilibacteria bacterium]
MHILLKIVLFILSIGFTMDVFAATAPSGSVSNEGVTVAYTDTGDMTADKTEVETPPVKQETEEEKKDREKTINDINTFLIESYKLKVDRILANLNLSIERVTNNDPEAQAKLLEKIRNDINVKIQVINSRSISENRKKILFSVFSYIQENLDDKISHLVGQK